MPGRFSTGSDSPVSSDSSTIRSLAAASRASAGTRSPSASIIRSPRTTSAPGDAQRRAVANHQRARAGQVAQRLERALGLALLHHGDRHHHHDRGSEHQRLAHVAEQEVDQRAGDEQQEHRLAQDLERDGERAALRRRPAACSAPRRRAAASPPRSTGRRRILLLESDRLFRRGLSDCPAAPWKSYPDPAPGGRPRR